MVLDADAPDVAAELATRVREHVPVGRDLAGLFGSAMMAHTRPWRGRAGLALARGGFCCISGHTCGDLSNALAE